MGELAQPTRGTVRPGNVEAEDEVFVLVIALEIFGEERMAEHRLGAGRVPIADSGFHPVEAKAKALDPKFARSPIAIVEGHQHGGR